jgi:ACS family hexuronate transporter-like MFS transporter
MKIRGMRWFVCGLLFLATVISYIDRQTISIAAPVIAKEFSLSNEQIATILSAFLFSYTFGQLLAGRFFDWLGSRHGFVISVSVWSLANMLTSFVTRPWGFSALRFLLGVGESGNFPGGVKVVTEWFPASERAFAGGFFASGASIGAIIAGPLVGTITYYWGWRAAFVVTGALGFVWLIGWLLLYHPPEQHPRITAEERAHILTGRPEEERATGLRWGDLFRYRQVWALFLGRLLEEPIIWMSVFWLPKYFVDVHKLTVLETGWMLTQPFIALDIGYLGGGWISSRLVRRGWTVRNAKFSVMSVAAVCMTGAVPAGFAESSVAFTVFISLATLGHGMWFSNVMTIPSDIAPRALVASVYGISGMGGGLGGILATEATGTIADRWGSYTPAFVGAGLMPLAATALLFWLLGREPIEPAKAEAGTQLQAATDRV